MRRLRYEPDPDLPEYVKVPRERQAIAYRVLGWATEPNEDTSWSGYEERTGKVLVHMVGDDQRFGYDLDELAPIPRESFCGECGQMGCTCDGLERGEAS